ncbi:MAG: NADPH:quinone reductase-like Zn-dependent oxidoreductase [Halieaceae bacterium]|jgi:NADPH:quinone reductase-like Zn-dependent oxidoreductase
MKAIVYKRYGPPEVLQIDEVEKPLPLNDEVLIKIFAAEATKSDCEMRSFKFAVKWFWLPLRIVLGIKKPKKEVLGGYFSGQIELLGKDVSRFSAGDQVFGSTQMRLGSYGEYLCLPASYTIGPKPKNLSFAEAAAVPLGGFNALHYMRKANIKNGEKVLINGAGASIGTFAVQIAKAMGAEVTAVDSSIKEGMLRDIGADHFVDYTRVDFTKSGRSYDVIFNMVANTSYSACITALRPGGRYLMGNPRLSDMLRSMFTPLSTDKTVTFTFARETEEELLTLKTMIEAGEIKPVVDQVYPMAQAAEAHRRVEAEQRLGIIVITIAAGTDHYTPH